MPGREAAAPGQPWLMDLELWVQGRGPAAQGITREARRWLGAWGRSRGRSGGCGRPRQCPQPPAPAHPQGLQGLAVLNPASPPPGSRALIKLYQAERTSKHCFVAMATRETRATWSISEESPYYREFKGKVLKNAERLGRVIRLGALRANASSHEASPERLAWLRKHRDTQHNSTSNPGGDGADTSGCPGTQPLLLFCQSRPCRRGLTPPGLPGSRRLVLLSPRSGVGHSLRTACSSGSIVTQVLGRRSCVCVRAMRC